MLKVAVLPIAPVPVSTMLLLAATELLPVRAPTPPAPLPVRLMISLLARASAPSARVPVLAMV